MASDTMGLLLTLVAPSAGIQDRVDARALPVRLFLRFECLKSPFVDGGCTGTLIGWVLSMFGWDMQVIKRCQQRIFKALPKRWIVERTFAWLSQARRLSKDCEDGVVSAEAFVKKACIRRMVRLLG